MEPGQPSRTAWGAARHRAAHQLMEGGRIFTDPLAVTILGETPEEIRADAAAHPERTPLRFFIAARSRFAEDKLAEGAAERGVSQLVVLGAGFDTQAYRNRLPGLHIFEVDHPATQTWKRARLAEAGIPVPGKLTFASVDFEREDLRERLVAAGFDPQRRSFFAWLGVVPYLSPEAICVTLAIIAGLPGGAEVVFDYSEPAESLSGAALEARRELAERVAAAGEPLRAHFVPEALHEQLRGLSFTAIEDCGAAELAGLYLDPAVAAAIRARAPGQRRGAHVLHAAT